jgi:hypothetical protein
VLLTGAEWQFDVHDKIRKSRFEQLPQTTL